MKTTRILTSLLGCFLFMTTIPATAQDNIETRVGKLEKVLSRLPEISGLINLRYQYELKEDDNPYKQQEFNRFDVRRARLDFKGNVSVLDYRLQLEFASSPKVLDAYITWKAAPALTVQAGQFKIPFSLENPYGPTTLETIDNSLVIKALCNYEDEVSGIKANGRDIGISVKGGFFARPGGYKVLNYHAGIFNGAGINTTDDNNVKDFSGIITVNPIKQLTLAGSYYLGSLPLQGEHHARQRGGLGVKFETTRWLVRSEFIHGNTGVSTGNGQTDDIYSDGYYAVAGFFITPALQLLAKYDFFQKDIANSTAEVTNSKYLAGIRYIPSKNLLLMANYSFTSINNETTKKHGLTAQVLVSF
ncbi:MAG: OprO/OprP family phosphate-selective porin [Odoribacteraceae bacterium]|jgi:phosphate-selective porin|nr:OprO/OprP family phosphate-selective porin [Odoribacteraceae bacterium]